MPCGSTDCSSAISTDLLQASPFAQPTSVSRPWRETLRSVLPYVSRCHARRNQRRALIELDDHLLADIGVSREEAFLEAQKLFWE
jgi:uncharacterized protein YjiS (DUF1127 family)